MKKQKRLKINTFDNPIKQCVNSNNLYQNKSQTF